MNNSHFIKIDDAMFTHQNVDYYILSILEENNSYYYMFARKKNKDTEFLVEKRTRDVVEFLNECSIIKKVFNAELVFEKGISSTIIDFIKSGNITSATSSYIGDIIENSINFKAPSPRTMMIGDEENYLDKNVLDKIVPARPTKK